MDPRFPPIPPVPAPPGFLPPSPSGPPQVPAAPVPVGPPPPGMMPPGGMPGLPTPAPMMPPPPPPPPPDPVADLAALPDDEWKALITAAASEELALLRQILEQQAPDLAARVESLIAELADPGPKWPDGYPSYLTARGKPKKPTAGEIETCVRRDEGEYGDYRNRVRETIEWLLMRKRGTFSRFDKKKDEPFQSNALAADHNARVAMLAGLPVRYQHQTPKQAVIVDSQKCEDFCFWAREQQERQHAEAFAGPLAFDEGKYLDIHGMLVTKVMMDPEDDAFPFIVETYDPATCFPVPGDRHGLERLTRAYRTTLGRALAAFDRGGKLSRKLLGSTTGEGGALDLHTDVEVLEYYDRWWYGVTVAGQLAFIVAHRYGRVPFVITVGGWGMPMQMAELATSDFVGNIATGEVVRLSNWYSRCVGPVWFQIKAHSQYEAVMGAYATALRRGNAPAWVRRRSLIAGKKPAIPIEVDDNTTNLAQLGEEELDIIPAAPPPQVGQPMLAALNRDFQMSFLPMTQYGAASDAQTTGAAIENLNEGGRDKIAAHLKTVELHHARVAEHLLGLVRDWGDILGPVGDRGVIVVPHHPARREVEDRSFELTPEVVKRAGSRVKVKMTNVTLRGLLPLVNAGVMGINAGVMSRRYVIDLIGEDDPQAMLDELKSENAAMDPRVRDLDQLLTFAKQAGIEVPPDALFMIWAKIISQGPGGAGGAGGGPGGPGGGPPGIPPGMAAGGMQGPSSNIISMPPLGLGPGPATGRPPGAAGAPVGAVPNVGAVGPVSDFNPY